MVDPRASTASSPTLDERRLHDASMRDNLAEREMHEEGGDEPQDPPPKIGQGDPPQGGPPPPDDHDPNEVTWGPDDTANPLDWTTSRKWWITAVASLATLTCTLASSAPSAAVLAVSQDFGVSEEVANLITTLFLIGYVTGPLIWAPGSELIGRRPIFLATFMVVILLQIGQALAQNITTLLVCRFLSGVFAASPITNAGGVIADIWDPVGRGAAMAVFSASTFIGPVCGPFIGGFLTTSYLTWRWIFWLLMIIAGANLILIYFCLPETFSPVLLVRKADGLRKADPDKNGELFASHERLDNSPKALFHRTLYRPFHMLLVEPMLQVVTVYISVVYGLLYGLFEVFPIIWGDLRGFSIGLSGLIFIGVGIGSTIGAVIAWWLSREYVGLMREYRGSPPPEPRLKGAIIAGPFFVVGIFFLGWTGAFVSVPWWVPAIATIVVGVSFSLIFITFLTYIVDVYVMYAASALAANTIVRSAVAAGFPEFMNPMIKGLGIQWACTVFGCIGLLLAPSPIIFYKYGSKLRERSTYAPCLDIKVAKELEEEKKCGET